MAREKIGDNQDNVLNVDETLSQLNRIMGNATGAPPRSNSGKGKGTAGKGKRNSSNGTSGAGKPPTPRHPHGGGGEGPPAGRSFFKETIRNNPLLGIILILAVAWALQRMMFYQDPNDANMHSVANDRNSVAEERRANSRRIDAETEIMRKLAKNNGQATGNYVPEPFFQQAAAPVRPPPSTNLFSMNGGVGDFVFSKGYIGVEEPDLTHYKAIRIAPTEPGQFVRIPYQPNGKGLYLASGKYRVRIQADLRSKGLHRVVCQNIDPAESHYRSTCVVSGFKDFTIPDCSEATRGKACIQPGYLPGDNITLGGVWLEVKETTVVTLTDLANQPAT